MKHLKEGRLRAIYDGAVSQADGEPIRHHLDTCARCARVANTVRERGARLQTSLSGIGSHSARAPVSSQVARRRMSGYLARKQEKENVMLKTLFSRRKLFSRPYRPAWVLVALVLALG